jgi:hypothetical protein
MRAVIGFFILFIVSETGFSHPLHLSITNIDFKNDSVFISMRLFQDDFSAALIKYYESTDSSITNNPLHNNFATEYLNKNFILYTNSNLCPLEFLYSENDELSVWYYFKAVCTVHQKMFEIHNSLMIDFFTDQKNMVIINYQNQEDGYEFDAQRTQQTIQTDEVKNHEK